MVLRDQKIIFFHVPKVAGHAIEQFLMPAKRNYKIFDENIIFGIDQGKMTQHLTYNGIKNYIGEEAMDTYFKFAFFRNTWDRLASAFFYLEDHYKNIYGTFDECIKKICIDVKNDNYQEGWHFSKQTDYLFKNKFSKEIALDFMGIYENFDEDFKKLCKKINRESGDLKHSNKTVRKTKHYREYFSKELVDIVNEAYKEEIDFFNFKF